MRHASLLVRHLGAFALATACLSGAVAGQQGSPVVPATETPAAESPQTGAEAQGQQPGRRGRRARGGEAGAEAGQGPQGAGAGAQGEGRQGGRGGNRELELPEFTPVAAPPLDGLQKKQFFWFTMYPDLVAKFDPTTDQVVQTIKLAGGLFWSTQLTHDQKRMLVVTNQQHSIEVVDLQTGQLVGNHLFEEAGYVLRIRSVKECPGGVFWLVRTERVKKEIDRYSFEAAQWLLYDSQNQKVVRKVPKLPEVLERGAELSADGTHWVGTDNDGNLAFYDARKFTELGKIDLKTPRFFGAGTIRLTGTDLLDGRDPTRARMLFSSSDPVEKNRTQWGVCEIDLQNRRIVDVTEWGPNQRGWGMRVSHKAMVGATMSGGRDDEERLMLYDLHTGKLLKEAWYEFRPRRGLVAISPDGDKVYVGVAGSDLEVFDAELKRLSTVELPGEISGRIHVVDG